MKVFGNVLVSIGVTALLASIVTLSFHAPAC